MKANNSKDSEASTHRPSSTLQIEALTPIAQKLNCLEMKKIADVCINEIPKLIGATLASLYILDETSDILHLKKNNHPFLINNIVSLNQKPPSHMVAAVRSGELMTIENIESHKSPGISQSRRSFASNYTTKSCMIAPLICFGRVVGVLNLTDKVDNGVFTNNDIAAIELFRQIIGASIGNIKLFEKTQHLAQTDGLTGMLNHRAFYETLEQEMRRSHRYGSQVSIIMADIDNLKLINDNYGHRAGDLAIKQIGRRMNACIRQIDVSARYGGDEFAVILPNTSLADAVVVAERMVEMIAATPVIWENNEIPLSVSVGVGQYSGERSPGDVAKATDEAMYAAKQAGKNTVRIFQPEKSI